jgi:NTP pyrophosphatase (non-canonical NTP hydrolase)
LRLLRNATVAPCSSETHAAASQFPDREPECLLNKVAVGAMLAPPELIRLQHAMPTTSLDELTQQVRQFAAERDWDQFHTPKNLAMALVAEAGELAAEFQWLTAAQSAAPDPEQLARIRAESADVLIYLVRLAERLGFDLLAAANAKLKENERRYPVEKARGSSKKYTEY